jgi:hypothetical protein
VSTHRLLAIALASLSLCACTRREGLNFDCTWVPELAVRVDLQNPSQVRHLVDDLRTADELAIRYGDRLAGWRAVESFGIVWRHGGLKDRELGWRSRQQCVATLLPLIASRHGVTTADLERVRPQLADRGLDLPVTIPIALVFAYVLARFTRWIGSRFDSDEGAAWVAATVFGSVVIPVVVLAMGSAWAGAVEIVRLGNEHIGQRARVEDLRANFLIMLGFGIVTVWTASAVTAIRKRTTLSLGSDSKASSAPTIY